MNRQQRRKEMKLVQGGKPAQHPEQPFRVDLNQTTSLHCPHCMSAEFLPREQLFEIPCLLTDQGKPKNINVRDYFCPRCAWSGPVDAMKRLSPQEREAMRQRQQKQVGPMAHGNAPNSYVPWEAEA